MTAAVVAVSFDYSAVASADQDWLRTQRDFIRDRVTRTARSVIEIGARLRAARDRIEDGAFKAWCAAELNWSLQQTYRFMNVAEAFGTAARVDQFAPSALYLLAWPGVPAGAREHALELAKDGAVITHAQAKEIIAMHRPRPPKPGQKAAPKRPKPAKEKRPADDSPADRRDAGSWRHLLAAVQSHDVLHFSRLHDDEFGDTAYAVTAYPLDPAAAIRREVRSDLGWLVAALVGQEPHKQCVRCEATRPHSAFCADGTTPDGRGRYCRPCESARGKERVRSKAGSA